jgi:hypothetical protein
MSDWYYAQDGQQKGPIASSALRQLAQSGALRPGDMVWREGMSQWATANSIPNLFPPGIAPPPLPISRPPAHTAPPPLGYARPAPPPDPGATAGMRWLLPVGRSGWAIAAGYLGLLSVLVIPAPLALITGILALVDMRRHPQRHGMGRAIFGLLMGIFGTVGLALLLFALLTKK